MSSHSRKSRRTAGSESPSGSPSLRSSKSLARMALVCPAWWRAARRAAGYRLRALQAGHTSVVYALAGLPGGLLASGSDDNTVRVWEVESGRLVRALAGHTGTLSRRWRACREGWWRAGRRTRRCACGRLAAAGWCGRLPGTPALFMRWRCCQGGWWRAPGRTTVRLWSGVSLTLSANKYNVDPWI